MEITGLKVHDDKENNKLKRGIIGELDYFSPPLRVLEQRFSKFCQLRPTLTKIITSQPTITEDTCSSANMNLKSQE